jgi:hypothetical protein
MSAYDDMDTLGQYLGEFSSLGDIPTSLSGYGIGQGRHVRMLGELGVASNVAVTQGGAYRDWGFQPITVSASNLQTYLKNTGGAKVTGRWDPQTAKAWNNYLDFLKLSGKSEPHPRIAPKEQEGGAGVLGYREVLISQEAFGRLKALSQSFTAAAKKPAAKKPAAKKPAAAPPGAIKVSTADVQEVLVTLGHSKKGIDDGQMGPTTRSKYVQSTRKRGLNQIITGSLGSTTVLVSKDSLDALRAAAGMTAQPKPAPEPAPAPAPKPKKKKAAPAPAPKPTAKNMVIATADVQTILKQLGAPPDRLSDGKFGRTTKSTWEASAAKRKLDPFIALKTKGDLKTVVVREDTYYGLKKDADAKGAGTGVPAPGPEPVVGSDLLSLPPDVVISVPASDFVALIRLFGGPLKKPVATPDQVDALFKELVAKNKLDPRTQPVAPSNILLIRKTWVTLNKLAEELTPVKPKPGPKVDEQAREIAKIKKASTTKIKVVTIRAAFNSAIQQKIMKREPFKAKGGWRGTLREPLLNWMGLKPGADRDNWGAALTKGTLVSDDKKTVKLPSKVVKNLQKQAKLLKKELKKEEKRLTGYTEVNPSDLITKINNMAVSDKKFDTSGGPVELSDAIKTFLENTKRAVPGGNIVDTDKPKNWTKVYVKTDVLNELAKAALEAQKRADVTKAFRDNMVSQALSASTAVITVKELQQAMKHIVLGQESGASTQKVPARVLKLYKRVGVSSNFDKKTRKAYTETARGLIIGPMILQFENLLKQQLGPRFSVDAVAEVRKQVWNQYLDAALKKKKGKMSLKTLPAIAKQVELGADAYRKNVNIGKQREEEQLEWKKQLAKAIAKSTAIVSVLDVQQALLQMATVKMQGLPEIGPTGVVINGFGDTATDKGLLQLAEQIFPRDYDLPELMWAAYLKNVGIKVINAANVIKEWNGANYIALPPSLANTIVDAAGKWIDAHGDSALRANLAPLPAGNESLRLRFKDLTVLAAKKPGKPEEKEVFTGDDDDDDEPVATAPVTQPAQTTTAPVTTATDTAAAGGAAAGGEAAGGAGGEAAGGTVGPTTAGGGAVGPTTAGGGAVGPTTAGGAQITGPQITGPTINIQTGQQEPAPPPVVQAGMGGGMLFGLLGAAGVLALLLKGGDGAPETGDERF